MPETQLQAPGGVREGLAPGCRPTRSSAVRPGGHLAGTPNVVPKVVRPGDDPTRRTGTQV